MAELTREAFLDIQNRLAKETADKEDRRQQEIKESNSRLNKNLNDLGDKLAKAQKDGDKDLEDFLQDQITATNRQISDNNERAKGEKDYRNKTVKSFEAREAALQELGKQIEGTGRKAEQDAEFRREQNQLMIDKIDEQLKGDLTDSQREELKKERKAVQRKQDTTLNALKDGIAGLSEGFKKIGDIETGIPGLTLGRLAILAVIPLLINFLQSEAWQNLKKFLVDGDTTALLEFFKGLGPITGTLLAIISGFVISKIVKTFLGIGKGLLNIFKGGRSILRSTRRAGKGFAAFGRNLFKASDLLDNQGRKLVKDAKGRTRVAAGQQGAGQLVSEKNVQKQPSKLGKVAKTAARLTKFIPGVGLATTAIFGLFDGITAGMEEAKKEGATKLSILKEGVAGTLSGLTFGLVSQEGISGAMSKVGEGFQSAVTKGAELAKQGFDKAKEGFGTVFNRAKEAFTPSEEFKNRLKSLNPFPKIREGLKDFKPFEGLRAKLGDFKFPKFKLGSIFSGVATRLKSLSIFADAIDDPEERSYLNPFKTIGSIKGLLKDAMVKLFPKSADVEERQAGGFLPAGRMSIVGETGAELIMSKSPVQVFNESRTDSMGAAALNKLMSGGGMGGGGQVIIAPNQVQNNTKSSTVRPIANQDPIIERMTSSLAI